jgi:hypothetical protein
MHQDAVIEDQLARNRDFALGDACASLERPCRSCEAGVVRRGCKHLRECCILGLGKILCGIHRQSAADTNDHACAANALAQELKRLAFSDRLQGSPRGAPAVPLSPKPWRKRCHDCEIVPSRRRRFQNAAAFFKRGPRCGHGFSLSAMRMPDPEAAENTAIVAFSFWSVVPSAVLLAWLALSISITVGISSALL